MARIRCFCVKTKRRIESIESIFATSVLLILAILLVVQVFSRYVLSSPLTWSAEVARYAFVWLVFIGSALIAARNEHIAVTFLEKSLPERTGKWLVRLSAVVVTVTSAILAWASIEFVVPMVGLSSPGGIVDMVYVYAAPVIGFGLIAMHAFEYVVTGGSEIAINTRGEQLS